MRWQWILHTRNDRWTDGWRNGALMRQENDEREKFYKYAQEHANYGAKTKTLLAIFAVAHNGRMFDCPTNGCIMNNGCKFIERRTDVCSVGWCCRWSVTSQTGRLINPTDRPTMSAMTAKRIKRAKARIMYFWEEDGQQYIESVNIWCVHNIHY